jgi:hypothetical protein
MLLTPVIIDHYLCQIMLFSVDPVAAGMYGRQLASFVFSMNPELRVPERLVPRI